MAGLTEDLLFMEDIFPTLTKVDLDTWVLDALRTRSYVTTGSVQEQR
jgi:hypothetical protein